MTAVQPRAPSATSASLIKMEERKRALNDHHDSAPPSKKMATSTNGAGRSTDADMPWKDDLEKFQKDALLRQIQEYKRERKDLEKQASALRESARDHDSHLRIIDAWLKQLVDEVKLLLPDNADSMDLDSLPSSLQFKNIPDFEQHLSTHSTNIQSLISRLAQQTQHLSPEQSDLYSKMSRLLAVEKEHLVELDKLRAETQDLDERLQAASLRYMLAEKKLDRAKSVTAAKLDKGLLLGGPNAMKEESNHVKKEETTNGVDSTEDAADLQSKVDIAQATAEKQKEQIAKLEEDNAALNAQLTELMTKSSKLSDDDYSKTELYKQFKAQHENAVRKLNDMVFSNAKISEEITKLNSERTAYQTQLVIENQELVTEKDAVLSQTNVDLARVRNNRDDLLADQAVKKVAIDEGTEALKKYRDLSAAYEDRITALESENQRLSDQVGHVTTTIAELDSLTSDELKSRLQDLEKKYTLLNGELSSMQSAYQKSQKLATQKVQDFTLLEEKTAKAAAEKAKADQKYFAAMKTKEMRDLEIRGLKTHQQRSSEIVSSLKDAEATTRALAANLEKQLAESKAALNIKSSEHQKVLSQSTAHASEITRLNAQVSELKSIMLTKDAKVASTSSAARTAEVELEKLQLQLESTNKSLEAWKSKSGQHQQYEILRQLAYCQVCKQELKNTSLKTCGHCMCNGCVEKQIQLRSRKCPLCGKPFGKDDSLRITL